MLNSTSIARPLWRQMASIRKSDCSLDEPKKRKMAQWYSEYSKTYDDNGYHTRLAKELIDGIALAKGDRILDIATGTGLAGIFAMEKVQSHASLVAVDISSDMLSVAKKGFEDKGIQNVELIHADGQKLDFDADSFDVLICSSALVLFPDIEWTLSYWRQFLRPGGQLAVHCFSEESYIRGKLIQRAAAKSGIELIFSEPTGTVEKCEKLMSDSGYVDIHIKKIPNGNYLTLESVLTSWEKLILHPMVQLPELVSAEVLDLMKEEFYRQAMELETPKGVWDDDTIMYVYAKKPDF